MQKGGGQGSDLDMWSWRCPFLTAPSLPLHLQHWAGAEGDRRSQTLSVPHAQVDMVGSEPPCVAGRRGSHVVGAGHHSAAGGYPAPTVFQQPQQAIPDGAA